MKFLVALGMAIVGAAQAQLLPPNAAGVTMGHVHLNVKNVEAQKKFWMDLFGATPLQREGLQGVKVPGMLILFTQKDSAAPSEGAVIDHFGFKVRNT
jgi:catechol 2,3-dioxygenase-like lactoylglutathione lyase family enzyme